MSGTAPEAATAGLLRRFALTLSAIRFSHSIFALPFALLAAFLAAGGPPELRTLGFIVAAAVGARTAAMAWNRIADRHLDARNPRTASRELPAGKLSVSWMAALAAGGAALLVYSAGKLNPLCLALSGPTLVVLFGYSYAKRFTPLSHVVLGLALGLAPVGAWIAVTGGLAPLPLVLCAGVLCWTAGFDVLYSLQDEEHDRAEGLHSIPARLGAVRAIAISRLLHAAAFLCFVATWYVSGRGGILLGGTLVAGALLLFEQSIVKPGDLSRLDAAFFTANGLVSVVLFLAGALDLALLG